MLDNAHRSVGMRAVASGGHAPGGFSVHPRLDDAPRPPRARVRLDARLDAMTRQKVDDLARHFHQPRAAVLRYIMHWGLDRGPMDTRNQEGLQGPVHHLYCYVDSHLYAAMQQAATTAGVTIAP